MNILFFLTPKSDVAFLYDDETLRQALEKMEYHKYSAVPVISRSGKYIGTITEGDMLWGIKNQYDLSLRDSEHISVSAIKRRSDNRPVYVNATMEDLIDKALNQNFVPVVDDQKNFIGIITRKDIISYCYGKIREAEKIMNFQEIGRFEAAGRAALKEYGMEQWKFELLHCSENATFLVTEPKSGDRAAGGVLTGDILAGGARKWVMRVARPGYHTLEELESEIRWVEKIWEEKVIPVARPVRNWCGDGVTVAGKSCKRFACVMFEFLPGHAPDPRHDACALEDFREIGRMAAKLHEQVIHWPEAETLSRPHWDYEHMLGPQGLFGDWRLCRELDESGFQTIQRVCEKIRENLTHYGKTRENYGLIHSDLRAANLLKDEHCIHAIDFDDSGFGWFLYDAAAAISFVEDDNRAGEWLGAWVSGYREVRPLSPEEAHLIPTFVMARRIQLMAWITSHDDSDPVKVYYRGFAEKTAKMGERFLMDGPDLQ